METLSDTQKTFYACIAHNFEYAYQLLSWPGVQDNSIEKFGASGKNIQ
jgi:hypothetical protein